MYAQEGERGYAKQQDEREAPRICRRQGLALSVEDCYHQFLNVSLQDSVCISVQTVLNPPCWILRFFLKASKSQCWAKIKARGRRTPSGCSTWVQGTHMLGPSAAALPNPLAENLLGSGAVRAWMWYCNWQLYRLCHNTGPLQCSFCLLGNISSRTLSDVCCSIRCLD